LRELVSRPIIGAAIRPTAYCRIFFSLDLDGPRSLYEGLPKRHVFNTLLVQASIVTFQGICTICRYN